MGGGVGILEGGSSWRPRFNGPQSPEAEQPPLPPKKNEPKRAQQSQREPRRAQESPRGPMRVKRAPKSNACTSIKQCFREITIIVTLTKLTILFYTYATLNSKHHRNSAPESDGLMLINYDLRATMILLQFVENIKVLLANPKTLSYKNSPREMVSTDVARPE